MAAGGGITETFAEFVVGFDLAQCPPATVSYCKELALSHIGCVVWGSSLDGAQPIIELVRDMAGKPESGVIGAGFRAPVLQAVMANATSDHASELEGISGTEATNPMTIWPVAFTLGELLKSPGDRVLEAFITGHEVQSRLARACPGLQSKGGFPIGHFGSFGAAAAAAKLLRLDTNQTRVALSVAASSASGLQRQVGTMMHYLEAGLACRNGVMAALLSKRGLTADMSMLDDAAGDWNGYCTGIAGGVDLESALSGLGNPPFRVDDIGNKLYPCCHLQQRIIYGLAELTKREAIRPDDVAIVTVEGNRAFRSLLDRPLPRDFEEARFSVQHGVASAIIDPHVGHRSFLLVADQKYADIRQKVRVISYADTDETFLSKGNRVIVELNDGRVFDEVYTTFKGERDFRLTTADVQSKYAEYASSRLSASQINLVQRMIFELEKLPDVSPIMEILTYPGQSESRDANVA